MDNKKISEEKNAAEILADEQLDSVAGGTSSGPGMVAKELDNEQKSHFLRSLRIGSGLR